MIHGVANTLSSKLVYSVLARAVSDLKLGFDARPAGVLLGAMRKIGFDTQEIEQSVGIENAYTIFRNPNNGEPLNYVP
jgi:hypothetical protein